MAVWSNGARPLGGGHRRVLGALVPLLAPGAGPGTLMAPRCDGTRDSLTDLKAPGRKP